MITSKATDIKPHDISFDYLPFPTHMPISERLSTSAERLQTILLQQRQIKEKLLSTYHQLPYSVRMDSIPCSSPLENAILLGILSTQPKVF